MNPQVNWQKIRDELQRLADVDKLKNEVHRIGTELRKFDLNKVLSPKAAEKVKSFEKRYADVVKSLGQAQVQVDREFNKLLRQIKDHRSDVTKVMNEQKGKLEKISTELKQRFKRGKNEAVDVAAAAKPARPKARAAAGAALKETTARPARATKRNGKATRKGRATQ